MSILIFATHSVVDEILYIISFFCKVLILLQIALQGRIKISMLMKIVLCVVVDLTMISVYLTVIVDL